MWLFVGVVHSFSYRSILLYDHPQFVYPFSVNEHLGRSHFGASAHNDAINMVVYGFREHVYTFM